MAENEPAEHAPLTDARRSLACCMTALQAAVHAKPSLGEPLGRVHAALADLRAAINAVSGHNNPQSRPELAQLDHAMQENKP